MNNNLDKNLDPKLEKFIGNVKAEFDNLTYKGTPVRIDNFMPAQAQAEITSNRQSIAGLLNKYNPDINIDL